MSKRYFHIVLNWIEILSIIQQKRNDLPLEEGRRMRQYGDQLFDNYLCMVWWKIFPDLLLLLKISGKKRRIGYFFGNVLNSLSYLFFAKLYSPFLRRPSLKITDLSYSATTWWMKKITQSRKKPGKFTRRNELEQKYNYIYFC